MGVQFVVTLTDLEFLAMELHYQSMGGDLHEHPFDDVPEFHEEDWL